MTDIKPTTKRFSITDLLKYTEQPYHDDILGLTRCLNLIPSMYIQLYIYLVLPLPVGTFNIPPCLLPLHHYQCHRSLACPPFPAHVDMHTCTQTVPSSPWWPLHARIWADSIEMIQRLIYLIWSATVSHHCTFSSETRWEKRNVKKKINCRKHTSVIWAKWSCILGHECIQTTFRLCSKKAPSSDLLCRDQALDNSDSLTENL